VQQRDSAPGEVRVYSVGQLFFAGGLRPLHEGPVSSILVQGAVGTLFLLRTQDIRAKSKSSGTGSKNWRDGYR